TLPPSAEARTQAAAHRARRKFGPRLAPLARRHDNKCVLGSRVLCVRLVEEVLCNKPKGGSPRPGVHGEVVVLHAGAVERSLSCKRVVRPACRPQHGIFPLRDERLRLQVREHRVVRSPLRVAYWWGDGLVVGVAYGRTKRTQFVSGRLERDSVVGHSTILP